MPDPSAVPTGQDEREIVLMRPIGPPPMPCPDPSAHEWHEVVPPPVTGWIGRFLHNVIAHPLLVLCPPLGEWLHERTEP